MIPDVPLSLSGERWRATYRLRGDAREARALAVDIGLEGTVEFPADLLPDGDLKRQVVGRLETLEPSGPHHFEATLSYAVETAGGELAQFVNVVFGNVRSSPSCSPYSNG